MAIASRSRRHAVALNGLALSVTLALTGCGESTSSVQGSQFSGNAPTTPAPSPAPTPSPTTPPTDSFSQTRMLESIVDNVIVPTFEAFTAETAAQHDSISDYCNAISGDQETTALTAAQDQWKATMSTWQMAELMQIGPLLENNSSLRNRIYSWPNVSSCAVDQDVVLAESADYDISNRTVSRKGLDALEYLLFNTNLNHSCTAFGTEPVGWNSRTDEDRKAARCAFAQIVADDLDSNANTLLSQWQGEDGYGEILKQAGMPGSDFTDAESAINDISDALFYIDSATKDAKLATPLGLFANDCGLQPCAQNVESRYANHSLENIQSNIRAFTLIYQGGESDDAVGFDDYLQDVGDSDTATQMLSDLNALFSMLGDLSLPLAEQLESAPEEVEQLHSGVKSVTDNLKTDFIQSLALELPATSAGDND